MMATVLGARASQAQPAPSGPAGSGAAAPGPAPTVVGNTVVIPVPSASATVAGPSATVGAPPPMLMVPQPAGAASGQVPNGYMVLVPWTPPTATAPAAPTPVPEPVMTERSYAHKLVIADLSALGLFLLAAPTQSGELVGAGVGVYALGSPIMHLTEGNLAKGAASLGLRLGMPVGGFYVGAGGCLLVATSHHGSGLDDLFGCFLLGLVTGGAGLAGAVAIDYAILGKEKVPAAQPKGVSWAPTFKPSKDGMTLGMVGSW